MASMKFKLTIIALAVTVLALAADVAQATSQLVSNYYYTNSK